ncbi:MAG: phage baseplate assembly protein V [Caldilineaceae bacterium]|nr:phage baseplate assembly protein V [Caldilineaceae bacterium]
MSALTTLPEVIVELDGRVLRAEESQALVQVRVQQRLSVPTLCELSFHSAVGSLAAIEAVRPGAALTVRVLEQEPALFVGQITALEYDYGPTGAQEICLRGYDALHQLRQRQSVQAYRNMTVADLARQFAQADRLAVQVAEDSPVWPTIVQHRQNDLELLVETAAYSGLYLAVREQTLHLFTLAGDGTVVPLHLGEALLEARVEVNADAVAGNVVAGGWNPLQVTNFSESATQARSGRHIGIQIGGSGIAALVNEAMPTRAHALALAQAELDYQQGCAVTLWGVAAGNTALQPGIPVEISGIAAHLTGQYVLTAATHLIDGEVGFVTEVNTLPPALHRRPQSTVATFGVVTQVDDPDHLGRVQVRLSAFQDVETDWLGVLMPAAGANKGLIALPNVGDTVLVLLTHENPGQGIVLGGLYGEQRPPDSGVTRNNVRRQTWVTPNGQRIQLDDDRNLIRIENGSGSYIELSRGDVIIAGQAIDFRRS